MRIAVLGRSPVAIALALGWKREGHEVVVGVERWRESDAIGRLAQRGIATAPDKQAVLGSDVLLLAKPWPDVPSTLDGLGVFGPRILIDATVPDEHDFASIIGCGAASAAELIARWLPHFQVVKAFNAVGAATIATARHGDERPSLLYCGNHAPSKQSAAVLAAALGFEAIDLGPLATASNLESLALLRRNLEERSSIDREVIVNVQYRSVLEDPDGKLSAARSPDSD